VEVIVLDNINNRYIPVRERIFTLLKSKGISQREFAEAIGVHAVTITDWKNGKNFSFVKRIPDIAQALDTTEVWLLTGNLPDLPAPAQRAGITMNREIFVQNIKNLCMKKGIKPTNACIESGVSRSFISDINRGQTPSVEKVQMLAQYLGVTVSELLGEGKPTPGDGDGLNEEQLEIVKLYESAPPALRAAALAVLRSSEGQGKAPDGASTGE